MPPLELRLPEAVRRPILACGAGLGSTICIAQGKRADVFPQGETPQALRAEIARMEGEQKIEAKVVACDPHPAYASTKVAHEHPAATRFEVQHHRAHLAAVVAEHGLTSEPVVGAIHDNGGFGTDGTVWGGEILSGAAGGLAAVERRGLLFPVRMPGGEVMVHERWRMACAWLVAATGTDLPRVPEAIAAYVGRERWEAVADMARTGVTSPLTTSTGRLLDAVDAITGRARVSGSPTAQELAAASPRAYPMPLIEEGEAPLILDARETLLAALTDLEGGADPATIRARFMVAIADGTARALTHAASRDGIGTAVLAGDTFAALPLLDATARRLRAAGMRVLTPDRLPAGDSAISFGQAAVAAWADRATGGPHS